jgi:hypothetical protein
MCIFAFLDTVFSAFHSVPTLCTVHTVYSSQVLPFRNSLPVRSLGCLTSGTETVRQALPQNLA